MHCLTARPVRATYLKAGLRVRGAGHSTGGRPDQLLDVGCERQLLAVEAVRAVVREEEADGVEVVTLLDLLLVELQR